MDRESVALGEYRGFRLEAGQTRVNWWEGWAIHDGETGSGRTGFYVEEVSIERVLVLLRERVDRWHGKPDVEPPTST